MFRKHWFLSYTVAKYVKYPYGNSKHRLQSRDVVWLKFLPFKFQWFQLPTATLKTLEEDPDKYIKISYQISQDHQETKISTQNQTPQPPPHDAALWASLTKHVLGIDIGSSIHKHRHHGGMAFCRCPVERCRTSESRGGAPWDVSEGSCGAGVDLWGFWQLWLEAMGEETRKNETIQVNMTQLQHSNTWNARSL